MTIYYFDLNLMTVLFCVSLYLAQLITLFNYTGFVWKEKAKRDIQELGMKEGDWILLSWGRCKWRALVNMVMNFRFP